VFCPSLTRRRAQTKAARRRNLAVAQLFVNGAASTQPFRHIGVTHAHPTGAFAAGNSN
jgi:hypothetical protein